MNDGTAYFARAVNYTSKLLMKFDRRCGQPYQGLHGKHVRL